MHEDQAPYRLLYDLILDYEGTELYAGVVRPWLQSNGGERVWLADFAQRRGDPVPAASVEDLWRLYALSRIVELVRLGLAPSGREVAGGWRTATILHGEYVDFMDSLGLQRIVRPSFHPFFHEIVTVDLLPEETAPIAIVEEYWPGYMLGPLLLTRAGCAVAAGAAHLTKEVAEHSILYWAFARRTRPTEDLSRGWGSNSQWRTDFRRDYVLDGRLHYNVDAVGKRSASQDEDLTDAERLELLRHRCFVQCVKPDGDRWPYASSHVEEA